MVAIAVLVIGAALVLGGITLMSASSKARSWPVVPGTVVERTIGPSTTTGASRPGRYFEPRVTYHYTVDGKSYTGHRITMTTNGYDEDRARKVANELPERVEVHYNPGDPSDAVLQPSAIGLAVLFLIIGVVGVLVGAGLLYASFAKT